MRVSVIYGLLAISAMFVISSEAVKCHINRKGDVFKYDKWGKVNKENEELCPGMCVSTVLEGEYKDKRFNLESDTCNPNGAEKSFLAAGLHRSTMYDFHCGTELCNNKTSLYREEAKSLLEKVNNITEKHLTGKSSDLSCYNNNGELIDCKNGFCILFRNYTKATADTTWTGCYQSLEKLTVLKEWDVLKQQNDKEYKMVNHLLGNFGLFVKFTFEGKVKKTDFFVYCRNSKCNEKNSLDAEFDSIVVESLSASTAIMPALLVISAMVNM